MRHTMRQSCILADGTKFWLRPPTPKDISLLYEAAHSSRDELAPWMPWCHSNYSRTDTETWVQETFESNSQYPFLLLDESETHCLGTCGLNDINERHRCANLGYWVRTSHIGLGIATAATAHVANFGFAELELLRVEIVAALGNHASQRVAEKVGATREGILRNGLVHGEHAVDAVLFSLIPADLA